MTSTMIERALTAVAAGQGHRQCFNGLGREKLWREFFVRVGELPSVHPAVQNDFLDMWRQHFGWMLRSYMLKDDAVLLGGLWKLLPPYAGPPIDLWRGQLRGEPVGVSWTSSSLVARKFALYGTRLLELCDACGDFSETILAADVARRGLTPRANAVVLAARQVTTAHIVCAPCLHGYDYEDEYVVDPRGASYTEENITQLELDVVR
jgi:hypothetical protein